MNRRRFSFGIYSPRRRRRESKGGRGFVRAAEAMLKEDRGVIVLGRKSSLDIYRKGRED